MTQAEKRQVLDAPIYAIAHAKTAAEIAEKDHDSDIAKIFRKDYEAVKAAYEIMCREVGI